MKIRLLAVGHKMPQWVQQTCQDYNQRLSKQQRIELVEIIPIHRTKSLNNKVAKEKEGQAIVSQIKNHEKVILLDEYGQSISTKKLAHSIKNWQMNGEDIVIIIGGADGVSDTVKKKAHVIWSLSELTFPHPLVRVILMEQIYRAYSLIANHPYHRE